MMISQNVLLGWTLVFNFSSELEGELPCQNLDLIPLATTFQLQICSHLLVDTGCIKVCSQVSSKIGVIAKFSGKELTVLANSGVQTQPVTLRISGESALLAGQKTAPSPKQTRSNSTCLL